ncbi:MAG: HAMP domain-containing histidine kinase [Candidatus Pacebacteria bacterium]|nr:HAMP domain-containing histidine kinase [Candidatus Paceibacterota bacterium]
MINSLLFCAGDPVLFGVFDPSYAPALLYYAYVPIVVFGLLLGIVAWLNRKKVEYSTPNKIILFIAITHSLYLVNEVLQWLTVPVNLNFFSWQLMILFRSVLLVLLTAFVFTFVTHRSVSLKIKVLGSLILLPVLLLFPTSLNISHFDVTLCEGIPGVLHDYLYALEAVAVLFISYVCFSSIRNPRKSLDEEQVVLVWIGSVSFVLLPLSIDLLREMFNLSYEIGLITPFGVLIFLGTMTYMMVKYKTFNTKIFASQALVATLWILIGSLLLVVKSTTSRIITTITLMLSVAFGVALVRSVRKEVDSRNMLAEANAGQERFIHFLSHEVKGYLTVARNGFAAIGQGDLGPVSEEIAAVSRSALSRMNDGVNTVENILKSANLKSGKFTFAFAPFDLASVLHAQVEATRPLAEGKNLALSVDIPEGEYICVGDRQNLADHVFRNLIENAIYYTEQGSVRVSLTRVDDRFVIRIVDTGIGISAEDKQKLFTEGGRGVDSLRHNVHSTGHGLFIAKSIVEAHKGTVRANSEGQGRGTTFEVELPVRRR